jgi:hypothetical protein
MLSFDADGVGTLQVKIQDEVDVLGLVLDLMATHDSQVSPPSIREGVLGVFRRLNKLAEYLETERKRQVAIEQRVDDSHQRELARVRAHHPRQNHHGDGPCAACAPPGPLGRPTEIECVPCGVPAGQPCRQQTASQPAPYYCHARIEAAK